jgi:hypothetical protein
MARTKNCSALIQLDLRGPGVDVGDNVNFDKVLNLIVSV